MLGKRKKVLDSQATSCKNRWGRQGFFFPPPQNKWGNFFFFTPSNLTLNLNANRSGKYVLYAFFLGWDSLGMQLELAWALCLGLEQGSCSKLYVTLKCWDTILTRYAVKIISLGLEHSEQYLEIDTTSHWVIFLLLPFLATFSYSKTPYFLHFPTTCTCFCFEVLTSLNQWFLAWTNQLKHAVGPYFCIILSKFLDR